MGILHDSTTPAAQRYNEKLAEDIHRARSRRYQAQEILCPGSQGVSLSSYII